MAIEYARLYPDTTQLQAKNGANLTDGYVLVFLAGTDDPAVTYSDFNGTRNPQRIVVDDNGRFTAIVDKSKAYRVEVYDANGMLLWTAEPVWCTGNSGAGISSTRVVSTDGSISVDESVAGSERTYDIGIAPADSDEFLEWVKCVDEDVANGDIFPTYVDGTMETMGGQGLHVGKDRFYHGTVTIKVVPTGTGINYETLSANLKFGEDTVVRRNFDIDNSLHDSVVCEFSYDFKASEDGYLYLNLENVGVFSQVDVEMQVHRIYSGINAVPDTCATKQWVQETFDYDLSGKIGYSALEYNGYSQITGISGSAIATTDPSIVSAIASSYAESAVSGKVDQSAFDDCCSAMHSALDDKLDKSASSMFALSGDYAYNSSLSGYIPTSASGEFAPSGDYAFNSSVSSKLDASASGDFVLVSSYSSFSSEVTNNISSISSTVSGLTGQYIEQSASGMFAPSGNYVSASDMSAYVPFSGLEGDGSKITGISGSAIKGHEYSGIAPVNVDNAADTISVDHRTLAVDETMSGYVSGDSAVIGVNTAWLNMSSKADASSLSSYQPTSAMSAYATESWVSGELSSKLDVTASSQFITALPDDLATTSDVASAVSGKMDLSASSEFYPMTDNPAGYLTAHQSLAGLATVEYVDSSVSGKLDTTAYDSAKFQLTADMSAYQLSGDYAYNSSVSGKQDVSAMTAYQEVSGMTAYQPVGIYIYESALGWEEV